MMLRIGEEAFEELVAIDDAEELCRRLLASPRGWGRSTRHTDAVELLAKAQGTSELPMSFVALMLCTCRRWDRVTMRLIAAIEDSGLLDSAALEQLGESFLAPTYTVSEDTLAHHRVCVEPPLRRWAAKRALRSTPARLQELLRAAELFGPRDRSALIHGLIDAADVSRTAAAAA